MDIKNTTALLLSFAVIAICLIFVLRQKRRTQNDHRFEKLHTELVAVLHTLPVGQWFKTGSVKIRVAFVDINFFAIERVNTESETQPQLASLAVARTGTCKEVYRRITVLPTKDLSGLLQSGIGARDGTMTLINLVKGQKCNDRLSYKSVDALVKQLRACA